MSVQNSGSGRLEGRRSDGTDPEGGRTEWAPNIQRLRERIKLATGTIQSIIRFIPVEAVIEPLIWDITIIIIPVLKYIPLVLCVITFLLDPLFCYLLVLNEEKKCLGLDKTLGFRASIFRSVIDLCYMVHRVRADDLTSLKLCLCFVVDILVTLPLPQVLVFYVIPKLDDPRVFNATAFLNFIFIIQYVLRVARIYSLLKKAIRACCIQLKSTRVNLCLLMLAGHVVGSFWYLFSIERKVTCWLEVCKHFGAHCSLYCDGTFKTTTYLKDTCSTNSPNPIPFNFGIYSDAIESGVVDSVDLIQRISYCFWWGVQNLSSLGHNLKTSAYLWEVYFSIFILISGLVLISALIGAMQAQWLSKISGPEIQKEENPKKRMGLRNEVKWLEENKRLLEQVPKMELRKRTGKQRQSIFKDN